MTRATFLSTLLGAATMNTLHDLDVFARELPTTDALPVIFAGHGSPMNAIEENEFVASFRDIAQKMAKPAAVLCISAHWYTRGTKVTAMTQPKTIHDFGGFPRELYQVQYPAPGSPELAHTTKKLLSPTLVELDEKWGLDHGTWSVLKHFYPKADIPVVQLSIDYTQNTEFHFELASRLQSLRERGILIVGSGNIVHNLGMIDFQNFHKDNYGYDWAAEARHIVNSYILDGNIQPLLSFEKLGKAMQLAVPTPDHYLPLMYTLGLKRKKDVVTLFNDKLVAGSLSMTSVMLG